jgi:hypothetical protein
MSKKTPDPQAGKSYRSDAANALRRQQRLEELTREMMQGDASRRQYALQMLLARLWITTSEDRQRTASALMGYAPGSPLAEIPECAVRFCAKLRPPETEILPTPPDSDALQQWVGEATGAVLQGSLDTLKWILRAPSENSATLRQEVQVCRDALLLAQNLRLPEVVEPCLRILRLFPADLGRRAGPFASQTTLLRELACCTLAALPPNELALFWENLSSDHSASRVDLLPVLDYLNDVRALPYLIALLEKRGDWADREMVGWAVVRAFEHVGDRKAGDALREIIASASPQREASAKRAIPTSAELAREAHRVLEAIERNKNMQQGHVLLRPARSPGSGLLRPADRIPEEAARLSEDLLRARGNPDDDSPL